jgi:myo-inositol-1(or 4)-monophosphatase
VTDADVEAEQVIVETIRRARPTDEILGEESNAANVSAEHLWILDPIDGTNNFVHGIPHFAISIAYYRAGEPQCGVIYNPMTGDLYDAVRGQGAFCNGQRAGVSSHRRLNEALIGVGFYYDRGAIMEATLVAIRDLFRQDIRGIRRFGAASLDLCYVGCGMFSAFFELQLSLWDFAAGRLFVEEAGGRVTDCQGRAPAAGKSSILATNGLLHDATLAIIAPHERGCM